MISAMPAVAIRRERSKSQERLPQPMTRRGRFVEYYHRKISRMGSIRPPTARSYSIATTPDTELPPGLLVEMGDPYSGRSCPALRRLLGYVSIFQAGCVLIVAGLIVLFLSMGSIKADVTTLRALGSFFVALGALMCLLRTIFFKKLPEPQTRVLRLRSSESFGLRAGSAEPGGGGGGGMLPPGESLTPGITTTNMEVVRERPIVPSESHRVPRGRVGSLEGPHNGLVKSGGGGSGSPQLHLPKSESNGTERSPSPLLRPTSADQMLPSGPDEEKSL